MAFDPVSRRNDDEPEKREIRIVCDLVQVWSFSGSKRDGDLFWYETNSENRPKRFWKALLFFWLANLNGHFPTPHHQDTKARLRFAKWLAR